MQQYYDIFEKFVDGSFIWRTCVSGQFAAQHKIQELVEYSGNKFVAIDITTGERLPFICVPLRNSADRIKNAARHIA